MFFLLENFGFLTWFGIVPRFVIIGSASYIVREVRSVRERCREGERERESRKCRHHCRAKIGDEFTFPCQNFAQLRWVHTFSCQKFPPFVSPFTLPVSPLFLKWSPLWRWNSQWVHTFHCQKILPSLFRLSQMAQAARRVIENQRQMIKSCPVLYCSSHRKNESD